MIIYIQSTWRRAQIHQGGETAHTLHTSSSVGKRLVNLISHHRILPISIAFIAIACVPLLPRPWLVAREWHHTSCSRFLPLFICHASKLLLYQCFPDSRGWQAFCKLLHVQYCQYFRYYDLCKQEMQWTAVCSVSYYCAWCNGQQSAVCHTIVLLVLVKTTPPPCIIRHTF